jgi:membrane protein YqaA with SNARE-associated domain
LDDNLVLPIRIARRYVTMDANQTASDASPKVAEPRGCPRCRMKIAADAEFCEHCGAKVGGHRRVPWWHLHRRLYDWTLGWAYHPSAAVALFSIAFAESSFFPVPPDVLLMPLVLGNRRKWLAYAFVCSLASVLGAVAGFLIGWLAWESPAYVLAAIVGAVVGTPIGWMCFSKPRGHVLRALLAATSGAVLAAIALLLVWRSWHGTVAELFFKAIPGFTQEGYDKVSRYYDQYNFWIVFVAGFTPIPFKLITVTAGIFGTGQAVANPVGFFIVFLIAAVVSRSARFFLVAGLMRGFGPKITPFIDKYFNWLALLFTALLIGGFVVVKYAL